MKKVKKYLAILLAVTLIVSGFSIGSYAELEGDKIELWGSKSGVVETPASEIYKSITAGWNFTIALSESGEVSGFGDNTYGETTIPESLGKVKAVSAGGYHVLALKEDGTVTAWGKNSNNQCNVPEGLENVVAVDAGWYHSGALTQSGELVLWGNNAYGQSLVPDTLSDVKAFSCGHKQTLVLKNDGSIEVLGSSLPMPENIGPVKAVSAAWDFSVALKEDGTVVAWGDNSLGQCDVPVGLVDVKKISALGDHAVALKEDGTVVAWGDNSYGQRSVPTGLEDVKTVTAGAMHNGVIMGLVDEDLPTIEDVVPAENTDFIIGEKVDIKATVKDASGIKSTKIVVDADVELLNEEYTEIPLEVDVEASIDTTTSESSPDVATLDVGEHIIEINAVDVFGNEFTKIININVLAEAPGSELKLELIDNEGNVLNNSLKVNEIKDIDSVDANLEVTTEVENVKLVLEDEDNNQLETIDFDSEIVEGATIYSIDGFDINSLLEEYKEKKNFVLYAKGEDINSDEVYNSNTYSINGYITFDDITNHWAKENIEFIANKGIVVGYPDSTFRPDNKITRAEAVIIICRLFNFDEAEAVTMDFNDVNDIPDWAVKYVQTAVDAGWITGYSDNTFKASNTVTRAEITTMFIRVMELTDLDSSATTFDDDNEIPTWAKKYIKKAVSEGLIEGYPDNTFRAKNSLTRAEVSTISKRYIEKNK